MPPLDPDYKKLDIKPLKRRASNEPTALTADLIRCIQNLEKGTATAEQQKKALTFIINELSDPYNPGNWQPGQHSLNDHAAGRAFVGEQLVGILKINLGYFIQKENQK